MSTKKRKLIVIATLAIVALSITTGTVFALGTFAFVGGGENNTADGDFATVGAGDSNNASGDYASILGGRSNRATKRDATVGGGRNNRATAKEATVAGGRNNRASGNWTAVPGGRGNEASADYGFAAGRGAKSNHDGTFVWSDSSSDDFESTALDQFLIEAAGAWA